MRTKFLIAAMGIAAAFGGCGKTSKTPVASLSGPDSFDASRSSIDGVDLPRQIRDSTVASEVANATSTNRHNYEFEERGEYGYRQNVTAEERSLGVKTGSLILARYKGVHREVYAAELRQSAGGIIQLECRKPCQSVKLKLIVDGEVLDSTTVPSTDGSVIAAVIDDAQHGLLHVYAPLDN
ncbi:hypothetical protein [Burkholderia orbicola]|uniref:hypothetical protein n=1 Tax=Burkholderia orbicola TaxID=2978683 RepID=UPI002FE22BF0